MALSQHEGGDSVRDITTTDLRAMARRTGCEARRCCDDVGHSHCQGHRSDSAATFTDQRFAGEKWLVVCGNNRIASNSVSPLNGAA